MHILAQYAAPHGPAGALQPRCRPSPGAPSSPPLSATTTPVSAAAGAAWDASKHVKIRLRWTPRDVAVGSGANEFRSEPAHRSLPFGGKPRTRRPHVASCTASHSPAVWPTPPLICRATPLQTLPPPPSTATTPRTSPAPTSCG